MDRGAGVFQLSQVPNGQVIEPDLFRQFQPVVEFEERHTIQEQPGKLKFLFYASDGFMGSYNQAVAKRPLLGLLPISPRCMPRRVKIGGGLNLEQPDHPEHRAVRRLEHGNRPI